MNKKLLLSSCALLITPSAALAQSTGTVDFEKQSIVVTGKRGQKQVAGVSIPNSTKPKVALTQEMISRSTPGESILDTINVIPGVNFQNNDAYGSSGGTLTMRGFDSSRISLTFDGIPLNDSGNYAIYSNQLLDPELIEQVNVNLGTTDVDSPTASAVGGTVNFRTRLPKDHAGVQVSMAAGDYDFHRVFGSLDTGPIDAWGTRAFIAASTAKNRNPFNNYGRIDKQQYNAEIYQPIGANGDFVSIAGHYNQNRNNFFGSVSLRYDQPVPNGFPQTTEQRTYNINYPCTVAAAQPGAADKPNSCGTEFDRRYNPSNTGNIRVESRLTLFPNVVLTAEPYYEFVKANGGGTVTAFESGFDTKTHKPCTTPGAGTCVIGYYGGKPYAGADLNGDGDTLDQVTVLAPSETRTRRYGLISGLRWDFASNQTFRVGYTHDYANHRQTGEVGLLMPSGEPVDVFPINNPLIAKNGSTLEKRDRQSYAILDRVFGEYQGHFGALTVDAGLAEPFFTRDLRNYCFTSSASGFVECSGENGAIDALIAQNNPVYSPPQHRVLKYRKLLPNGGLIYNFNPALSVFVDYAKGLSVPGTDSLYNAFFFPMNTPDAKPKPETTDSFDVGFRYGSSNVQAQIDVWYTKFSNRLASAYDVVLDTTVYRNLGTVNKWGLDGSVSWRPIRQLTLYAWGSWNRSKIKNNIQTGPLASGTTCDTIDPNSIAAVQDCALTAGKYESGAPKYMYGVSATGDIGPVRLGATAKRTGPRYVFDNNRAVYSGDIGGANPPLIFPARAPAYWLVNVDARVSARSIGLPHSYFQFNIYNLFDTVYVGGFGGALSQTTSTRKVTVGSVTTTIPTYGSPSFVQIGAPRTFSAGLNFDF